LHYSNDWRDAIRQYQDDLSTGRYDPEWQRQAAEAMEQRAQGKFDKFKEEQFEEYWGQKANFDLNGGNEKGWSYERSAQIKMDQLLKDGVFKVGDIWKFTKVFEKENIVVEKEARITEIPSNRSMNFVVPSGRRASFAIPDGDDDSMADEVAVNNVTGPNMLALKILAVDGQMQKGSPGNVWTSFRSFRADQDQGTLAELRQTWFDNKRAQKVSSWRGGT